MVVILIKPPNEHLSPDSVSFADLAHPMYATGIGLVLYGIEQAEADHEEDGTVEMQHDSPSAKEDGKVDIFADMGMEPVEEVAAKPEPVATPEVSDKKKKKNSGTFEKTISGFFKKVFDEGIDD